VTCNNGVLSPANDVPSCLVASGSSAQPVLVQHVSSSSTRGYSVSGSSSCYYASLPSPATQGNAVIVGVTYAGKSTLSVADDKGDVYVLGKVYYDQSDNQSVGILGSFNVAAGARNIKVCFSGGSGGNVQPVASEFTNVIGFDGPGSGNSSSGQTITTGNLSPISQGDVIYQVAMSYQLATSPAVSSFGVGSQSGISWSFLSADIMDGLAAQYGFYNSTNVINPTMSQGSNQHWLSVAALLKTGTIGAVPSGMRIVHLIHENFGDNGGNGPQYQNPADLQLPSSGNLLVAMMGGGNASNTITSLTDSANNSWSQAGHTYVIANNDTVQTLYVPNASTSNNLSLTLNITRADGNFNILFYDIAGAAAAPLDTTAGATGDQSNSGPLTVSYTLTPASAGELVLTDVIWDFDTANGLVGGFFDADTFNGETGSGPSPVDQNNGWGHVISKGTSPISFTWSQVYSGNVGNWASMAAAFKPK
jgi:hypothetical protein